MRTKHHHPRLRWRGMRRQQRCRAADRSTLKLAGEKQDILQGFLAPWVKAFKEHVSFAPSLKKKKKRHPPLQTRTKVSEISCFVLGHLEGTQLLAPSARFHSAAWYLLESPHRNKAVESHHTYSITGGNRTLCLQGLPFHACLLLQGASLHPVFRCWTNSFWLYLPPRGFSPGETFPPGITWQVLI